MFRIHFLALEIRLKMNLKLRDIRIKLRDQYLVIKIVLLFQLNPCRNKSAYHFQLVHDKELEKQILALGPGASVLKPELLKCKIIDLIHEMNDSYK